MIEKSILLVDDERRMTESLRDLFRAEGFAVRTANSGAEAIEAMKGRSFPVVVTDLRMQGVDGLHVIRFVHENLPKTLVIVITGYASTESAIEALHYQAFDYIRKPFEFDHLKAAVDRAFHKLEVDQLREDTAAMITHDIKVPLTSILGFASMLYDKEKGEPHSRLAEFAETIRSNAQKILSLVDNYLTTCKIESDTLTICSGATDLHGMIDDLVRVHEVEARKYGHELNTEIGEDAGTALLDETYVYRALGNLIQNAIKYGRTGEPIRLRIQKLAAGESPFQKETLLLEVINLAPEMEGVQLDELFGRYKRARASSGIEGSGIGLYVVDAVARAHGGQARAECLEGGKISFQMLIPLEPAESVP